MHDSFLSRNQTIQTTRTLQAIDNLYANFKSLLLDQSALKLKETQAILLSLDSIKNLGTGWIMSLDIELDFNDTTSTFNAGWDLTYKLYFDTQAIKFEPSLDLFFTAIVKYHPYATLLRDTNHKRAVDIFFSSFHDVRENFTILIYPCMVLLRELLPISVLKAKDGFIKGDTREFSLISQYAEIDIILEVQYLKWVADRVELLNS
jgi:hypothetical protein